MESRLSIYSAIAANIAITVTKFIAGALSGSSAMIAEGVHSVVDTGDGLLLLAGLHLSRKSPVRPILSVRGRTSTSGRSSSASAERLEEPIRREHPFVQHVYIDLHAVRGTAVR